MTETPVDHEARFNLGREAYNRGDWDTAFAQFAPLAEAGHPAAQYWLSAQHRLGLGAPYDLQKAWALILAAAEGGYMPARRHMAGECVALMGGFSSPPREYRDKAIQWLREDADAGDPEAQTHSGFAALYGFPPFKQDPGRAQRWFLEAANQGYAPAQFELGGLYASAALGRDYKESLVWYGKAADQGHVRAQMALAGFYDSGGNGVRKDQAKAREWYARAAQNGDLTAARTLIKMYERGLGVDADREQAFIWRIQAALLGDSAAAFLIGKAYSSGRGVAARDDLQAFVWLSLAALRDERFGDPRLAKTAPARDKVASRLTTSQFGEAHRLIDALKVKFVGDGEKWMRKPPAAAT